MPITQFPLNGVILPTNNKPFTFYLTDPDPSNPNDYLVFFQQTPDSVPSNALLSPLSGNVLTSPIDGRILLRAA